MRLFAMATSLLLCAAAPAVAPPQVQPDRKALEGRWALVSIVTPESRVNYEGEPSYFLIVARERMRLVEDDGRPGWTYAYRLGPDPGALEFSRRREGRFPLAYAVEEDRLTLAFPKAGKGRPKKLAIGEDCSLLLVFRRVKD